MIKDFLDKELEAFEKEWPLVVKYKQDGREIVDFDYMKEQKEGVLSFIESSHTRLIEEVIKIVEEKKLLEVAVNPESLMWKQRMNAYLDSIITKLKEGK